VDNKEIKKLEQKLAKKENEIKISQHDRELKYTRYSTHNDIMDNQRAFLLSMESKGKEFQFEWNEADKKTAQLQKEANEIEREINELRIKLEQEKIKLETKTEDHES